MSGSKNLKKLHNNLKLRKILDFLIFLIFWNCAFGQVESNFPFRLNLATEAAISGINVGLFLLHPALRSNLAVPTGDDLIGFSRDDLFVLDRITYRTYDYCAERTSHYSMIATLAIPALLAFEVKKNKPLAVMAVMGVESYLSTYLTINTLKLMCRRPRPEVYSGNYNPVDYRGIESLNSFPSGHTALAFTAAGFVHGYYSTISDKTLFSKILLISTYTAAVTSGFLRYYSGVHHFTDVLAGAAIGWSIGYLVPKIHMKGQKNQTTFKYDINPIHIRIYVLTN